MKLIQDYKQHRKDLAALFESTFSDSEGHDEGRIIGKLVENLLSDTADEDIFVISALEDQALTGSIIFTRLTFPEDDRAVFLMAPVAVATSHQGKGVGQALIAEGLRALREREVDAVMTYGDINYYGKSGFREVSEDVARAPLPLSYPEGWLGQSLTGEAFRPLAGSSRCVSAFNDPAYW